MFLRIASLLVWLEVFAHTFMFVSYVPKHGAEEVAIVAAMKSHLFNFGGTPHSYWDFYFGYGLFVSISCLTEAVLLWQLASIGKAGVWQIKPIVAIFFLGEAGYVAVIWKYFSFPVPMLTHSAVAVCLAGALVARRQVAGLRLPDAAIPEHDQLV